MSQKRFCKISLLPVIVCLMLPMSAMASGIGGLSGLYQLIVIGIIIVGGFCLILLAFAWRARNKGRGVLPRAALATPAILFSLFLLVNAFFQIKGMAFFVTILGAMLLLGCSLAVLLETRRQRDLALRLLLGFMVVFTLVNPRILNIWNYVEVDNDPFDGQGAIVKQVVEINGYNTDADGTNCVVDKIIKLEDGRYYPGIYRKNAARGLKPGNEILVRKNLTGDYAYTLYAQKKIPRREEWPTFDLRLIDRDYEVNHLVEIGGAYREGSAEQDERDNIRDWCRAR